MHGNRTIKHLQLCHLYNFSFYFESIMCIVAISYVLYAACVLLL